MTPAERRVIRYLPVNRMQIGHSFFVPPEMMTGGERRYDSVRQSIYRWGYRNGYRFSMERKDGGLWVKRVDGGDRGKQPSGSAENIDGSAVSDAPLQEPGVQEAHPVGAS
jgi:hypothetical protein